MMDVMDWIEACSLPAAQRRRFLREVRAGAPGWKLLPRARGARREAARAWERTRACGGSVITAVDPLYPSPLLELADAPLVLYLRGRSSLLRSTRRVAVVGSRRGTARARRTAEDLGSDLARGGVVVVSGLALGVDGAAHRGCLRAGGNPLGVIATGVDRVHPASHRALHADVVEHGLLVSENAPGTAAIPYQFVARNRILAGLAEAVVVVEAGTRSGALSTVDFALQMGREVFCVPGPPDCPHAEGSLALLREGATLVRHAGDVLESLGWEAARRAQASPLGLGRQPETAAAIAARVGRPLGEVLAELAELQLAGRVRREPGDRWRVTS